MNGEFNKLIIERIPNQEKANELMARLFEITRPEAVYSQPVVSGDYTIITASELTAGIGFGYGGGGGVGPQTQENGEPGVNQGSGYGGGGGGGGTALARPVAAVIIGPEGARVEPIVDPTKITLAFFTVIGAIIMTLRQIRQFQKTGKFES